MRTNEVTDAAQPEVLAAKLVIRCQKIATALHVPQRELGAAMLAEGLALLATSDGGVAALSRVRKLVDAFERRNHPTQTGPMREGTDLRGTSPLAGERKFVAWSRKTDGDGPDSEPSRLGVEAGRAR